MVLNAIVSLTAIFGLSFLGWCALDKGVDGTLLMLIVAAISGIAGYNAKSILGYLKGKNGGK